MKLNEIEQRFFSLVLAAELNVPIKATLYLESREPEVVIIPHITPNGHFELRYFNVSARVSKDNLTLENNEIFGVDPLMENAWANRDTIRLVLAERPHPFIVLQEITGPSITAKVILVDHNHKGVLAIDNNQVLAKESTFSRAEFSLVDFPRIIHPGSIYLLDRLVGKEFRDFQDTMHDALKQTGGHAKLNIVHQNRTNLYTKDGWAISLEEDTERTRSYVSYTGAIKKQTEEEFSLPELNCLLKGLSLFFTFASGSFRHPTATIGYDSDDNAIWGQVGRFHPQPQSTTWFQNEHSAPVHSYLENLFPRFWSEWKKKKKEIEVVVECYVESQIMRTNGLAKSAVAVSYEGLTTLAFLILKASRVDGPDWHNIDKALQLSNVPHRCLDECTTPVTFQLAKDLDAKCSGVLLLNMIRNYIMHPLKRGKYTIKTKYQDHLDSDTYLYRYLHDLCQFYLEYLLLNGLCGFKPQYYRSLLEEQQTSTTPQIRFSPPIPNI
ncbi:MAG: hypothetical protein OXJ55_21170 [Caldilineaceae bacterium]|nr:hypothetical protein [Caldilineaceae bacterium]